MVLQEAELESRVGEAYFSKYDYKRKIDKIDFCVANLTKDRYQGMLFEDFSVSQSLLWAEAKKGTNHDIYESFVQLILTIGKARIHEKELPPLFIGAFDAEKIAFVEYLSISDIFNLNDFNWNVTPSNHGTKEFKQLYALIKSELERKAYIFYYNDHDQELRAFIKSNFVLGKNSVQKILVTKNNFTTVYLRWLTEVKPTINLQWEGVKKYGIIDADFYLADLLSKDNESIKETLFVILTKDRYRIIKETENELGLEAEFTIKFNDGQIAHRQFWERYQRPPKQAFWSYIIGRRDLLVPQDVRERKGSFFTPRIWVEKSQEYLAEVLGEDWQDEYYVWDCCAGTGNLLRGLVNPYKIFASTIDKADVDVMKDQIKNGVNMLESHVFQFDFLNESFDSPKMPQELKEILNNKEKRKKLLIYINPPYAEAASKITMKGKGSNKTDVAVIHAVYKKYFPNIGIAGRELFAQFTIRIKKEIDGCMLGEFSKLKILQAPNFEQFRNSFNSKLCSLFLVPANTFDNVKGQFPIGFHIWDTKKPANYTGGIIAHVYDKNGNRCHDKKIKLIAGESINDWIIKTRNRENEMDLGFMYANGVDFQHQNTMYFVNKKNQIPHPRGTTITDKNLAEIAIYVAVRKCIPANWLNDRDQFIHPNNKWISDTIFRSNCLIYTLFNDANRIRSSEGINHWIPFSEMEVRPREGYESHFMIEFLKGFTNFSFEAKAVMAAARELYIYYHKQSESNPNASFYEIRAYFQGTNSKGTLQPVSADEEYTRLISNLREAHKELGYAIQPKVYEYGFLIR